MQLVLVAAFAAMLAIVARRSPGARNAVPVLLLAYVLRLLAHDLMDRGGIIAYGGDNLYYESVAMQIADYWRREGFQYVTHVKLSAVSDSNSLPSHLFAVIIHLCGGRATFACTALTAFVGCLTCVVVHRLARLIGADDRAAFRLMVLTAFMPAFFLHTSDTFKDGFNVFLVMALLAIGCWNMRDPDIRKLLLVPPLLYALWHIRPYMVFMCLMPLIIAFLAPRRRLSLRILTLVAALPLFVTLIVPGLAGPLTNAQEMLDFGQTQARRGNAIGGSSVTFDDGGDAWAALPGKLAYTVLAPFPWTPGSLALQLSKAEMLVWYGLIGYAVRGGRRLWHRDRRLLVLLLAFIVPSTVIYATTVANIGLIFRQRIPITMVVSLLSALAWTRLPSGPGGPDHDPAKAPERLRARVRAAGRTRTPRASLTARAGPPETSAPDPDAADGSSKCR